MIEQPHCRWTRLTQSALSSMQTNLQTPIRLCDETPVHSPRHFDQIWSRDYHYSDVIMGKMASKITSLTIVYLNVYSGQDQSPASLTFVWGFHQWPVYSPHNWPVTRKMFLFDGVIMTEVNLSPVLATSWGTLGSELLPKPIMSVGLKYQTCSRLHVVHVWEPCDGWGFDMWITEWCLKKPLTNVTLKVFRASKLMKSVNKQTDRSVYDNLIYKQLLTKKGKHDK